MSNELVKSDPLSVVSAELYRSYVLAGKQDILPSIQALTETAGAIIEANGQEARPIPDWAWQDVFAFARRNWALCGWRELISAWESNDFSEWMATRRRRRAAEKPKPEERAPVERLTWVQVWLDEWRAGRWVPTGIAAEIKQIEQKTGAD